MSKESINFPQNQLKVFIKTFGCQMNSRDSEALLGLFLEKGYLQVDSPEDADVILVNTCSVRDHAENRAISFLGTLKEVTKSQGHKVTSKENKNARRTTHDARRVVGLIGCMARQRGEEIAQRMPHVNLIVGPSQFHRILDYIEKLLEVRSQKSEVRKRIIDLEDKRREEDFYHAAYRAESGHAQVVISTGCSNYCSYCVVPFVRGQLRPRAPEDIIDEVKRNVELGIRRITLLGQNVNDYHYKSQSHKDTRSQDKNSRHPTSNTRYPKEVDFVELLKMVAEVEGVEEIDFVTSHPKNTSKELFYLMAESNKIKKHLHLPFQSGSSRILQLMNRGYTKEHYLELIDDYKKIVGGTLGADVIVGFPTEREEDFLETEKVLEAVRFNYAYIFKYSPRPNTQAFQLKDDVSVEEKQRCHRVLLDLQKEISLAKR